jgi:hypothetical protein
LVALCDELARESLGARLAHISHLIPPRWIGERRTVEVHGGEIGNHARIEDGLDLCPVRDQRGRLQVAHLVGFAQRRQHEI